jgi:signal transduction histidine kinase
MIRKHSIFSKLFWTFTGTLAASFLLFGLVYLYIFHLQLYGEFEDRFYEQRDIVLNHLELAESYSWSEEERNEALQIVLEGSDFFVEFSEGNQGEVEGSGHWEDGRLTYIVKGPLSNEGESMRMTFLGLEEAYFQAIFMIVTAFVAVMAIAAAVLWFVSRRMTSPLREMNETAVAISRGSLTSRVSVRTKDEIGELGTALNRMGEEIASAEETRKAFLANVSHDLRSPLTGVKGFLIALEDGTIPPERAPHYYRLMKEETDRVIYLVNDILDLTSLEAGKVSVNKQCFLLYPHIVRICQAFEQKLGNRSISLHMPDDFKVYGDPDRLNQVWTNLIGNAVRFAEEEIIISAKTRENGASVTIRDDGIGMTEEESSHVWDRFYKADASRSGKTGTGIGLSIVKSLVDLHAGVIELKTAPGEGTAFTVIIPWDSEQKHS